MTLRNDVLLIAGRVTKHAHALIEGSGDQVIPLDGNSDLKGHAPGLYLTQLSGQIDCVGHEAYTEYTLSSGLLLRYYPGLSIEDSVLCVEGEHVAVDEPF
jgi:hypothetical protein